MYQKSDAAPLSNLPFTCLPLDDVGNSEWEGTAAEEQEDLEAAALLLAFWDDAEAAAAEEELEAAALTAGTVG